MCVCVRVCWGFLSGVLCLMDNGQGERPASKESNQASQHSTSFSRLNHCCCCPCLCLSHSKAVTREFLMLTNQLLGEGTGKPEACVRV